MKKCVDGTRIANQIFYSMAVVALVLVCYFTQMIVFKMMTAGQGVIIPVIIVVMSSIAFAGQMPAAPIGWAAFAAIVALATFALIAQFDLIAVPVMIPAIAMLAIIAALKSTVMVLIITVGEFLAISAPLLLTASKFF